MHLPSQRTLRDYTYYTKASIGFSCSVDKQLMDSAKISECPESERYVTIIMDEMKIRENLVYNKHTGKQALHVYKMHKSLLQKLGEIIGYINFGDINNHLLELEQSMTKEDDREKPLAKSMLVLMVSGLFSKLQFAYAQFSCSNLSGHHLYPIFWEVVERLERCGFRVIVCTCDGLSVNRRFLSSMVKLLTLKFTRRPTPILMITATYIFSPILLT